VIETERLRLRRWRDDDRAPFAALNGDAEVGGWLAGPFTPEESDAQIDSFEAHAEAHGFTFWALAERESDRLLGMCGLRHMTGMPFGEGVEVGWRLARACWGKGYAAEAARACLAEAWRLGLPKVLAITAVANLRSRAVMERIGMTCNLGADFDHPRLTPDHPLSRHVLYSIDRPA
jgi:ribosomal-protein-alanine N-acetyltransferase